MCQGVKEVSFEKPAVVEETQEKPILEERAKQSIEHQQEGM